MVINVENNSSINRTKIHTIAILIQEAALTIKKNINIIRYIINCFIHNAYFFKLMLAQLILRIQFKQKLMLTIKALFRHAQSSSLIKYLCSNAEDNLPNLSPAAQKSVLATAIIREIISQKVCLNFSQPSLRDRILNIQPKFNGAKIVSEDVQDQVNRLFKEGVYLDHDVFSQTKIKQGSQHKKTGEKAGRFIFWPNSLTTTQMFRILRQIKEYQMQKTQNILITSGFGANKTVSIILYIQLSNYIHEFHQRSLEEEQQKSQLKLLKDNGLVDLVPKCWYWTIKQPQHGSPQFRIQDLILKQTNQLSVQKRQILRSKSYIKDPFQFKLALTKYYPNIIIKSVVDDTNNLAKIARIYDNEDATIKKQGIKSPKDQQFQILRKTIINNILGQLMLYRLYGNHCIFNSCLKIQTNLLGKYDQWQALKIHGHNKPEQIQIEYQNSLRFSQWAKIDFWQYIWFEIYRRYLVDKPIPQSRIEQIKTIYYDLCKQRAEVKSYYHFYDVRKFLKNKIILNAIYSIKQDDKIKDLLKDMIKQFKQYSLNQTKKLLINFMQKGSEDSRNAKKQYFFQLFYYATRLCCQQQSAQDIKEKYVQLWQTIYPYQYESLEINSISYIYESQIFSFKESKANPNYFKIKISPFQILQILAPLLFPKIIDRIPLEKGFRKFITHYQAQGFILYLYFLESMHPGTSVKLNIRMFEDNEGFQFRNHNLDFKIDHIVNFTQIYIQQNRKDEYSSASLMQNNLLELIRNSPDLQIFVQLFKAQDGYSEINEEGPNIDFIIAKYNQTANKYLLSTFGLTASKDTRSILAERTKAINLLNQSNRDDVTITHYILFPNEVILQRLIEELKEQHSPFLANNKKERGKDKEVVIQDSKLSLCFANLQELLLESNDPQIKQNIKIYYDTIRTFNAIEVKEERRKKDKLKIKQQKKEAKI